MWDDATNRPRGKTHAIDCHMIDSFHWVDGVKGDYRNVDVKDIPDNVDRCRFCGGGRPEPTNGKSEWSTHMEAMPGGAVAVKPPEREDLVALGRTARVREEDSGEIRTWTIVSRGQGHVANGRLSEESPVAKVLLGAVAGETITAMLPGGPRRYTVIELVS